MPNIPLANLGLPVPTITFSHNGTTVTRPITDHAPIIQNTLWGAIGTINILHPGSPIAPAAIISGVDKLPSSGQAQMEAMAVYIYTMFQKGVGLLTLQEVPAPGTSNFNFLFNKLTSLVGSSNLIDVSTLQNQWLKTGTHAFGTSVLCNPSMFKISKGPIPDLNNRVGCYEVTAVPSGTIIPVANMHGDFKDQKGTAAYLAHFDGFCLGDLNITHSAINPTPNLDILQSIERPEVAGTSLKLNTVDAIQDTYSRKFLPGYTPGITTIDGSSFVAPSKVAFTQTVQIPAVNAIPLLTEFTAYLKDRKNHLIAQDHVTGIHLKTPKGSKSSNITFTNQEVFQEYLQFSDAINKRNRVRPARPVTDLKTKKAPHPVHTYTHYPDAKNLHQKPAPRHSVVTTNLDTEAEFVPQIVQVKAQAAVALLQQFAVHLSKTKSHLVQHGTIIGTTLKTPQMNMPSEITFANQEIYNEYLHFQHIRSHKFEQEKSKIQQAFINSLDLFSVKLNAIQETDPVSYAKGKDLYSQLVLAQDNLFKQLTLDSGINLVKNQIDEFRNVCAQHLTEADQVMGHGWLYRTFEVLCKAVVGLFAALGMTLGTIAGQGLAKAEHRKEFRDTFFTWNKTEANTILKEFKDKTLGDEDKDRGLLDKDQFTP